jgi:hypothetical protein
MSMKNLRLFARYKTFSVLATATFLLSAAPAFGFVGFTSAPRDMLIGFRQVGGSYEMVVDLGQATNFYNLAPGSITEITNYSQETLDYAFSDIGGISWSAFSSVVQQVDTNQPLYTIWATKARTDTNVQTPLLQAQGSTRQSPAAQAMNSVGNNAGTYANLLTPDGVTDTPNAIVIAAGNSLGYYAQVGVGGNFKSKFTGGNVENTTPLDFASSSSSVVSDLYELQPAPSTTPVPAVYHGFFTFYSDGSMTFTAAYGSSPILTSISPSNGVAGGGTAVTITGSGFISGNITVEFGGIPATSVQFVNSTTVTAVTPAGTPGVVNVLLANPDGQSSTLANGFTYQGPPPTLNSISPTNGVTTGGTPVTITGSGFINGNITVDFGGIAATSVQFVDSNTVTAVTPADTAGVLDVLLVNADGQTATLAGGFTYLAAAPPPVLTSISPSNGVTTGGTSVTLTGSNFINGNITVDFGGIAATSVQFVDSNTVTAVTPADTAGAVNVILVNPDGQSSTLAGGFTYEVATPPPVLTGISPSNGVTTGGTSVTLTGSAFINGNITVDFGGIAATSVQFVDSNTVTAVTPADTAGVVDVTLVNPNGQSSTLVGAFTYQTAVTPPPVISSIIRLGTNLVIIASGATNSSCLVYSTTDLTAPVTNWTVLNTNNFDAHGLLTNTLAINPAESRRYFILATP